MWGQDKEHRDRIERARDLERAASALQRAWEATGDERFLHEEGQARKAHWKANRDVMDRGGY